jgi:hypothetical protein
MSTLSKTEAHELILLSKSYNITSKRSWSRDVKKLYLNRCLLSGLAEPTIRLHSHHLNSVAQYPHLQYCLLNGIPLAENIHKNFHLRFGQNVTTSSFIQYLDLLKRGANLTERLRFTQIQDWLAWLQEEMNYQTERS